MVSGRRENPAGKSSGVGDREGGHVAYEVAENPEGGLQGVEELLRGGKTSRVNLEGDGVPGADGRGQGGDGNSPATRDTKGSSNTSRGEDMLSGQDLTAP